MFDPTPLLVTLCAYLLGILSGFELAIWMNDLGKKMKAKKEEENERD